MKRNRFKEEEGRVRKRKRETRRRPRVCSEGVRTFWYLRF